MSLMNDTVAPLRHLDRFFIGGEWVKPSTDSTIKVNDSATEEHFFSVAEAQEQDMARAVGAARHAFDAGLGRPDAQSEPPSIPHEPPLRLLVSRICSRVGVLAGDNRHCRSGSSEH